MSQIKDLQEFLIEAELEHYYNLLNNDLKVHTVGQFKYVKDEDLVEIGMSKPEIRRLKKFFRKECPQGTFGKLKKILSTSGKDGPGNPQPVSPNPDKSPGPIKPTTDKHIIPEDAISCLKNLGAGEFGSVQQGIWTNPESEKIPVAVKYLSKEKMQSGMQDFMKEATLMQTVDHVNIVKLHGVVLGRDCLMMVVELAPLRSLLECLKEPALRQSFPVRKLCDFAIQICDGMAYLESKRFIHRDLAARNILVFDKDKVKISDFGLSRALGLAIDYYQTNFNVNLKLPIAWCSPECINYLKFTTASDVWAYGVTLWEIYSYGLQPWAGCTGQQVLDAIDEPNCKRLEQPSCCPKDHYSLMLKCWEHDPDRRPRFADLVLLLKQLKPEVVQAVCDSPDGVVREGHLYYRFNELITVLDKNPTDAPETGYWKGVMDSGKTGYIKAADFAPYTETKSSPGQKLRSKIGRKDSDRKSKSGRKFHAGMIGLPQSDLRHTGHIGYDGAVFGDVSFIGNNYDKLPIKVSSPYKTNAGSSISLPVGASDISPGSSRISGSITGLSSSSLEDTLTGESDSAFPGSKPPHKYEDLGDDDFDFKMPDLSSDLDLGCSLMDEVMKALSETRDDKADETVLDDKSPLIDREPLFGQGKTSFDNVAMTRYSEQTDSTDEVSDKAKDCSTPPLSSSPMSSPTATDLWNSETSFMNDSDSGSSKKRKPKLRILIPSREGSKEKDGGIKPMSASDEKTIDEAIELATEFAMRQAADDMIGPAHGFDKEDSETESCSSPSLRSVLGMRKKSPKPDKRTFTDEIAALSTDMNEEVTPEAQEAYNMLVVKGSMKDKERTTTSKPERRVRRVPELPSKDTTTVDKTNIRNGRNVNLNIRKPAGIPGRGSHATASVGDEPAEVDTNPLRRLRDIHPVIPRARFPRSTGGSTGSSVPEPEGKLTNGQVSSRGTDNLNPNLPFFAKLKEQEQESEQVAGDSTEEEDQRQSPLANESGIDCNGVNPIPLPPRQPLRPAMLNTKPRQRKYPLDLSSYGEKQRLNIRKVGNKPAAPLPKEQNNVILSSTGGDPYETQDSDDGVFTDSSFSPQLETAVNHKPRLRSGKQDHSSTGSQFSVKSVKLSAAELGLYDNSDSFWVKQVNFDDLVGNDSDPGCCTELADDSSPMLGRYKTSDNVSYEDLMEFALDGPPDPERSEQTICDEVRLMRKVLSRDVTIEDCMYALEETKWDVHCAIKLLKLKQLLSTNMADKDHCKQVLMKCQWNVEEAADYLLANPSGQDSPDIIHL